MPVIFEENPEGNLSVQVNKATGRIYGFYNDYPIINDENTDPNVSIVKINATVEEFAKEFDRGLYYKNGRFIRPVKLNQYSYYVIYGMPLTGSFILPEKPEQLETCIVQLKSDNEIIASSTIIVTSETGNFTLLPDYQAKLSNLKLTVYTNNYGNASASVFILTQENIDKAKVKVEAFERAIPDNSIADMEAFQKTVEDVAQIDFESMVNMIQNSNADNKEEIIKLLRSQLKIQNNSKKSVLNKLINFIKGGQND